MGCFSFTHRPQGRCSFLLPHNLGQQHRHEAADEYPVEAACPADRDKRGAQALNVPKVQQVGADQHAQGAADEGQRCGIGRIERDRNQRRHQRREQHRRAQSDAGQAAGGLEAQQRDGGDREHDVQNIQRVLRQQVNAECGGNHAAADVDHDEGPAGMRHLAVELAQWRRHVFQFGRFTFHAEQGQVDQAAAQYREEQQKGGVGGKAELFERDSQRAQLDAHHEHRECGDQQQVPEWDFRHA